MTSRRLSRVQVYPEMDRDYLKKYWANWWARLTRRQPQYPSAKGECVGCGCKGVLGVDLVHRGIARPTNLICHTCYIKDGGNRYAIRGTEVAVGKANNNNKARRPRSK